MIHLTILMWFARQASKISFSHALVLIGLLNFLFDFGLVMPNLVFVLLDDRMGALDIAAFAILVTLFALWVLLRLDVPREKHEADIERWVGSWDIPVFGTAQRRLAVRVLSRFDPARGISKELLIALFALNWLQSAYLNLRIGIGQDFTTMVVIAYWLLWMVIIILLAYAVRVDGPTADLATTEPKARPPEPFLCPRYGSEEKHPTS